MNMAEEIVDALDKYWQDRYVHGDGGLTNYDPWGDVIRRPSPHWQIDWEATDKVAPGGRGEILIMIDGTVVLSDGAGRWKAYDRANVARRAFPYETWG